MSDFTTPLPAGTDIGLNIGGKFVPWSVIWDSAGAEILGLLTANPDPNSISGRLKALLTALGTPMQASGGSVAIAGALPAFAATPTVNLGALNGAATQVTLAAVLTALQGTLTTALPAGAALDTSLQAILTKLGTARVETVWTDDTGAFYVRVDNAGTISWFTPAGAPIADPSGNAGFRAAAGASVLLDRVGYTATTAGTGYSVGDYLDHLITVDPASGVVIGSFWVNSTTNLKLAAPPAAASISPLSPLPTGAATQVTLAAVLTALQGALTVNATLGASETHLGKIGGETAIVLANFARPANTVAYASGQLVANNTAAASVVPMSLGAARINGGSGSIRRVRLRSSRVGSGTEVYRVHLFKGPSAGNAPVVAVGDGGVFATGVPVVGAIHMGSFDVTLDVLGSDGQKGAAAPRNGGEVNFDTWAGQTNIYALIEARGAVTPASGETFELALEVLRD